MKFHARLTGVHDLERPISIHGQSQKPLREWAKEILKNHPHGTVEIWESVEVLRERILPQ